MIDYLPKAMQLLIRELARLPSIGEKSAMRLAYHLVQSRPREAEALQEALRGAMARVRLCSSCFFLTEEESCSICRDESRDAAVLCVVEKPMDLIAIERSGEYRGRYHVLHGVWAPLRGKGPESIKLKELFARLQGSQVSELILACGSTLEGDATALYIAQHLDNSGVKITRLAQGVPKGGELEYLDDVTLSHALAGRRMVG